MPARGYGADQDEKEGITALSFEESGYGRFHLYGVLDFGTVTDRTTNKGPRIADVWREFVIVEC